ncbi:MAG: hypothetical protein ACI9UV_000213 [Algoriphagus sp.]
MALGSLLILNLMKILTHIFLILLFVAGGLKDVYSQNSFGIEFGHNWKNVSGRVYEFDSIRVIPDIGGEVGEGFGGLFYEYQVSKRVSIHNKLNYGYRFSQYESYNKETSCRFCPVSTYKSVRTNTLSFEFLPQVSLVKTTNFKLNLFGGINAALNFELNQEQVTIENQPGLSEVFNSLNNVIQPVSFGLAYGASIEIWRILFWAKVNPPARFTNSIEIYDQEYDFDNSWGFVSFSVGYKFYSLKRKKNSGVEN